MDDHRQVGARLTVREGRPDDAPFVVGLGTTAFARFGDYGPIMREFFGSADVTSFIAEAAGERVGFALVEAPPTRPWLKDLVAIAVDSKHHRTGVGRSLLSRVIASLEARQDASLLVLTVADDNDPAIALFRGLGFEMIPGVFGSYAGGQTSRQMARYVIPRKS
jgi:ribosomal protein S18 acetylase RimI-like enzyme